MNKEKRIIIRVTDEEKAAFDRAAEISGVGLSAWARQKLRTATIKELQDAGEQIGFLQKIPLKKNANG